MNPGITRAEISRLCDLTTATVSNVVGRLLQMGYVLEARNTRSLHGVQEDKLGRLGRPSFPLSIDRNKIHTVGLSCDLSHIQACIVNLGGELIAFEEAELPKSANSPADYINGLSKLYKKLIAATELPSPPLAVGLAAMGPLDIHGEKIYLHSSCADWQHVNFVQELSVELGLAVLLEKNFTAAALYEMWSGLTHKLENLLYIFLGHGVGGALILKNEIYRGSFANAGELGHMNVVPGGRLCLCGRRGCLETYLSLDVLQSDLKISLDPSLSQLVELFRKKDERLMAWLADRAELLNRTVGGIINLLDIKGVLLAGSFPSPILQYFNNYLEQNASKYIMDGKGDKLSYLLGRSENQPSLGAALLPVCELLNNGIISAADKDPLFIA